MDAQDSPTNELAGIVEETRRHLEWLRDAGITAIPRGAVEPARPAFSRPGGAPSTGFVPSAPPQRAPVAPPTPPAPPPRPAAMPAVPAPPPPVAPPPVAAAPVRPPPAPVAAAPVVENRVPLLKAIRDDIGDCTRCRLCAGRKNIVFGQGNVNAELLFVGEGPGADEDASGQAFVGRAGELLTKMIGAMGYAREQVYICNIVKCRPPDNRKPEPDEIDKCRPFVEQQIRVVRPKVIVALGATATQSLLRSSVGITKLRNTWQQWEGIPVMPTFHPSYLLRAPDEKRKAWDDLKLVMARLGKQAPPRG